MSEDVVNNPKHYNKQGIEVIEVIEAYTPNSPHLANVLKYVCRCEYKGKKLQDLKKASWYLNRAIVLLEEEERGLTRDEVAEQFEANAALEDRDVRWSSDTHVITSPDRIAGDNEAAKRIKDQYYGFDRYEIVGYCANCDAEISATQPYLKSFFFDEDLKFCKQQCIERLKTWQKDWKAGE